MPRSRRAIELFLSLGAAAGLLASVVQPAAALAQPRHPGGARIVQAAEGGEGGEGGEAGGRASARSDLDGLVVLAQMQGHLLVARELLDQRQFGAAEPHVGHPVDELYAAVEPALRTRGIPPLLAALEELRQQVRLDPGAVITATRLNQAQQAIAAAARALSAPLATDASTVVELVRQLAETAVADYSGAVAGDRVVETIEYQDARGFLRQGRQQTIARMLTAFPTVMPPERAVMGVAQLQQLRQQL